MGQGCHPGRMSWDSGLRRLLLGALLPRPWHSTIRSGSPPGSPVRQGEPSTRLLLRLLLVFRNSYLRKMRSKKWRQQVHRWASRVVDRVREIKIVPLSDIFVPGHTPAFTDY